MSACLSLCVCRPEMLLKSYAVKNILMEECRLVYYKEKKNNNKKNNCKTCGPFVVDGNAVQLVLEVEITELLVRPCGF